MRTWLTRLALTLSLLLLVACQPEPQPLKLGAIPWADGESSRYRVTDINGDFAGSATMTLTAEAATVRGEGWTLQQQVVAQGDQEEVVVEMQSPGLRPSFSSLVRNRSEGREEVKATYTSGQVDMELTTSRNVITYERVNIPSDARDQRALIQVVRTLPLAEAYLTQINSFLPITNLLERVTIAVAQQEAVAVPAGSYQSWLVELRTSERTSQLWIGVETPHQILKFIDAYSGATYELEEYTAGG